MASMSEGVRAMANTGATALQLFELWEKRDFDGVMKFMSDTGSVSDHPRGAVIKDRSEIRAWFAAWAEACPDSTAGVTVASSSDSVAVTQGQYVGTNTGPLGPLAATGRSVSMPFANVLRFDGDGRVLEFAAYYDQLTLLTQLGHIAAPS